MSQLVLVTGGTGFVGSHAITRLLENGYRVRATARSASKLQGIFPTIPVPRLEIVEVPTLTSDYTESLRGVNAVIHIATQVPTRSDASGDEIFRAAYNGTLHIVQQAIDAGIKKIIITGTFASLFEIPRLPHSSDESLSQSAYGTELVTEKSFRPTTLETIDILQLHLYRESKTVADKKVWELAKEHPDVDFTVLLPPAIFGPLVPNHPVSDSPILFDSIRTNANLCSIFILETYPNYNVGHMVDVRDVAQAHVAALSAPPVPGRNKRFIICAGTFTWKAVADLIRRERPELADRLPKEDAVPPRQTDAPLDTSFAAEVLGLKEYISRDTTLLAGIDLGTAWMKRHGL